MKVFFITHDSTPFCFSRSRSIRPINGRNPIVSLCTDDWGRKIPSPPSGVPHYCYLKRISPPGFPEELHEVSRKSAALRMQQFVGEEKNDLQDYLRSLQPEKTENLLLDSHGNLKVSDFGLSALQQQGVELLHTTCGTPNYIAPEVTSDLLLVA